MLLTIKNLSKTYKNGIKALDDISLDISSGMFGLLGPNGAGKSSMMRTIATLQEPDCGEMQLDDIDILDAPMRLRRVLGYLPQEFGVYPSISGYNLLNYFAVLKGVADKKEREKLVDYLLDITNLTEVRRKSVSDYSGGMKQRFGIAQMLLNKPKLIIVDEPTAGLDPAERRRFLTILREIGQDHIVIFSTHIVEDVQELCNDMAIMNQGRILLRQSPEESVRQLAGKIWLSKITKEGLVDMQSKYQVLSTAYSPDNTLNVRIYASDDPGEDFQMVNAQLEDVYFVYLNDFRA